MANTTLETIKNGKHWNARTLNEVVEGGKITRQLELHVGWVNYLDENGDWQEIDCNYIEVADGFEVTKAPFSFHAPKFADGVATFESNVRFDVHTKNVIKDAPMTQTLKALEAQHVQGEIFDIDGNGRSDSVIYRQAFPQWDADLIYFVHHGRAPRLKKLVRFNSAPPADLQINFEVGYNRNGSFEKLDKVDEVIAGKKRQKIVRTAWDKTQKVKSKDGFSVKATTAKSDKRGVGMKEFYIWDSGKNTPTTKQKKEKIEVDFEKISQRTYVLTKNVPASFFNGAVFPVFTDTVSTFYPDPNTETTSVDGYVLQDTPAPRTTWSGIRNDTTSDIVDDSGTTLRTILRKFENDADPWNNMTRSIFLFDTSSLPDTATISAVTLSLYAASKIEAGGGFTPAVEYGIVSSNPTSNTALAVGDYDPAKFGTTDFATRQAYTAITTSAYADFALNASGIANVSLTGISKFAIRVGSDIDNSEPSGTGDTYREVNFSSADVAGTTQDPKLVVTYTTSVDVTVSATVVSATFSAPASAVSGEAVVSPSVLTAVFSLQSATEIIDVSYSPPQPLTATFSIPAVNVITPDAQVDASVLVATFSLPAANVSGGANVDAGVLVATFSQPASSVQIDATVSAEVLVATFTIPPPTVSAISNITISASVLTATFSIPAPTITTEQNALIEAGVLTATFSIPAITVTAIMNVTVSASVLTATFSAQLPTRVGGLWVAQPRVQGTWTPQPRAV